MLVLLAAIVTLTTPAEADSRYDHLYANRAEQSRFIKEKIEEYFPENYPTMIAIASCESTNLIHWQADGDLLPNSTGASSAAGVFQVLLQLHGPDIRRMGLDVENNIDDYMTFVRWLYDRPPSRLSDWKASRDCWAPRIASN